MPAIPVTPAAGKSWRITEKAPPPQASERASFFKGTLEQARLAGLTDEEIASIAAALKPVLEKEEKSGDSGRSVKRECVAKSMQLADDQTCATAVPEPSSNPEWVSPEEHAAKRARHFEHHDQLMQAGSTSTPATPATDATTAAATQTAVTIAGTRKPPARPPATEFLGTGRHPRTADREETLRVLMTKISGHSNVDTDIALGLLAARNQVHLSRTCSKFA